jgi:hypothetical protein
LLAANRKTAEAIENLAAIIGDRTTSRSLRWQAVWLAPEIIQQQQELWTTLRDRVHALTAADNEMETALESLALSASGRNEDGLKLVIQVESTTPNSSLRVLQAFLEKKLGREADALKSFSQAMIEGRDASTWESFGFVEDAPLEQIMRLYLKQKQPRAALKLAESLEALRIKTSGDSGRANDRKTDEIDSASLISEKHLTLRARTDQRRLEARLELLELLSAAAEQIGDLKRADELAQTRLGLLTRDADRRTAELRIERLRDLQRNVERERKVSMVIDQKPVASE